MRKKFKCPECGLVQWQEGKPCRRCGHKPGKPGEEEKKFKLYLHQERGNLGQRLALFSWILPLAGAFLGFSTHELFEQASVLDILVDGFSVAVFAIAIGMALYGFGLGLLRYGVGGIAGPAALGLVLSVALFQQYMNDRRSTDPLPPPIETTHVSPDETVEINSPIDWTPASSEAVLLLTGVDDDTAIEVISEEWKGEFRPGDLGLLARRYLGADTLTTTTTPERTNVDGKPAYRMIYSYETGGQSYRALCTFIQTPGMIHAVVGWTPENLWLQHRLDLERMASSLKFLRVVRPSNAPEETPMGLPGVPIARRN